MLKNRRLLLVLADGEHVRFVRPGENNALRSDTTMDLLSAHKRSVDLGADHPGASLHSGSTSHHALAPRHDPHLLEKQKFAQVVAERLNEENDTFDQLVLATLPHTLAAIRHHLSSTVEAKIVGTLPKDLIKTPDEDLWPHVKTWVAPVQRPDL